MLDEILSQLEKNLQQQLELYIELRETAQLKQKTIVSSKIKELDALVTREEMLILKANKLEKERVLLANQIAEDLNLPLEDLTLKKLSEGYPQFTSFQKNIETVITDIQKENTLNTELVNQAMSIVNFTLSVISQPDERTYSPAGTKKQKAGKLKGNSVIVDKSV